MTGVLEVAHITVRLGGRAVVEDLSFAVERGETLAVIGPNGAGKTVLFRALAGALPHEGLVRWAEDARLGYVPQKLDLERDLPITAAELLRAKARLARTDRAELDHVIGQVGLSSELVRSPIGTLSGGQFQRLLVAFALVGRPNVLLLDEPTANVDEAGQRTLAELIDDLQRSHGLTVLFISHDLSVVFRRATNVLCLGRGPACHGPPRELLTGEKLASLYGMPVGLHLHAD